ncbi:ESPR-type extended signal peptide-containing protein [Dialister succinatiphilus]|uniref:Trimeric autotransporter adhesin YadA-like C-terminal membrane anchor domain-containing protein n=1 Tax=Dialister succinatiphilus YIT 11850 TaxID=742743 RepID=H1CYN8_9FIRM|nr:ESPR-type extended signal peptide-containing protein [Dialister succinatiphilus]EHO63459.1 hypothetical protein HMPREF9453_00476 [Dialister succinatiphilus YIT 11850]
MNRIYKVIYSKARQCAMVVSELAKSSHKKSQKEAGHASTPALARIIATVLAAGALTWGIAPGVSWAAPGNDQSAVVFDDKGSLMSTDATIDHNHEDGFGITNVSKGMALGHNAYVFNQGGRKANAMLFGSPTYTSGIAIGENAYALEDSIDLGNKIYKGAMGDVLDLSKYDAQTSSGTGRLLIGNNSYSSGTLSTLIGNHSIMTTNYLNGSGNAMQNAGAVSIGALNSIESYSSESSMSGVANSIIGLANKTTNANGALILGAGNEIKNSITDITVSGSASTDVATASQDIRDSMADGYAGGATLIIGGGNKTDYTQSSQIIGVGSSITGTKENPAQFNMLNGVQSHISNSSSVYAIGYQNTIGNSNKSIVVGDYHKLDGGNNNVIIGSMDSVKKTEKIEKHFWGYTWTEEVTTETPVEHAADLADAVMIGHNADVLKNGGVALGSGSIADTKAEVFGWDPKTKIASTIDKKDWKSSWAAVSVGDSTHTRQITNLAAGLNDTDAVNVAQLKAAMENAAPKIDFVAGDGIQIEKDSTGTKYTIKANITGGKTDTDTTKVITKEEGSSSGTGSSVTSGSGKALEITTETNPISFAADEGTAAKVKPSETLGILGDETNISTKVDGSSITVSLKKDITVDSVKAGNTTVNNEGVTIAGGPSMTVNGINAGGKKITNVADGTDASDAVNYGQLQNVENQVTSNTQNINYLNGRVGELGDRINKVGAGAAALAALHPLDYDPEDKWDFAAGVGNYRNATAAAVGLFYRPNERTMFNLGWTMGDNRNMVNGGFSLKFGKSNKYIKYSKAEMASVIDKQSREIAELKARDVQNAKDKAEMKADNAEMKAEIEALKKQVEALAAKK